MHKKLILAIAAFTFFAIAPVASATTLTEGGSALAVGSSITAKNTGSIKFTSGFGFECEVGHLQGTLTQNKTTGPVKWEIPVGGFTLSNTGGAPCSSPMGATTYVFTSKLCWETISGADTVKVTGCGGPVVLDMIASGVTCRYEAASLNATLTTNTTPATITISKQLIIEVGSSFSCPDEIGLDMTFVHYTTGGATGLTLS